MYNMYLNSPLHIILTHSLTQTFHFSTRETRALARKCHVTERQKRVTTTLVGGSPELQFTSSKNDHQFTVLHIKNEE